MYAWPTPRHGRPYRVHCMCGRQVHRHGGEQWCRLPRLPSRVFPGRPRGRVLFALHPGHISNRCGPSRLHTMLREYVRQRAEPFSRVRKLPRWQDGIYGVDPVQPVCGREVCRKWIVGPLSRVPPGLRPSGTGPAFVQPLRHRRPGGNYLGRWSGSVRPLRSRALGKQPWELQLLRSWKIPGR